MLDDSRFRSHLPTPAETLAQRDLARISISEVFDFFDVHLFVAEEPGPVPEDDPSCRRNAATAQSAIAHHDPIDTDLEWADVTIDLHEEFYLIGEGGLDEAVLVQVRELLNDGVVHGCISECDLKKVLCPPFYDEPDLERRLFVVLDELGIEIETRPWDENLAPLECRNLTPDEADLVESALAFLMALEPREETEIEACQRAIRAIPMPSDEEEAAQYAEVEAGTTDVLSAIAQSRAAVEAVLRVIHLVDSEQKPLRSVIVCSGEDDLTARLRELRTRVAQVRETLVQRHDDPGDSILDETAHKITSILSECKFTPQYLDEVYELLTAAPTLGEVSARVLAGIRRTKIARLAVVASNLRLVIWWVWKYRHSGLELSDLIGEGTLGLIRAVERYDRRREATLSTYGSWWIKQAIRRARRNQSGLIRTPGHIWEARREVLKHQQTVEQETGCRPTAEETASAVDISIDTAKILLGEREVLSLDADPCWALLEGTALISSDNIPENAAVDEELREAIQLCLGTLDPRLEHVIRGRFGFGSQTTQTLEEMSLILGVSRERVRQLEREAIRMLQHSSRARMLASFLGDGRPPAPAEEERNASGSGPVARGPDLGSAHVSS